MHFRLSLVSHVWIPLDAVEERLFLHAADCAQGLIHAMKLFHKCRTLSVRARERERRRGKITTLTSLSPFVVPLITDVPGNEWVTFKDLVPTLRTLGCNFIWTEWSDQVGHVMLDKFGSVTCSLTQRVFLNFCSFFRTCGIALAASQHQKWILCCTNTGGQK